MSELAHNFNHTVMLIGLVFFSAVGICLLIDEVKKGRRLKKHFDRLDKRWDKKEENEPRKER